MLDLIVSALSGVVIKIYDDFTENNIVSDGLMKECLHTLSSMLLGANAINDFTFVSIIYAVNFASHIGNSSAFSELKEKSFLYMFPIFFILSIHSVRTFNIIEILFIVITSFGSYNESYLIKEDVSVRKLIMRVLSILVIIGLLFFTNYFELSTKSLNKILILTLGYLITSCCFQIYKLFMSHKEKIPIVVENVIETIINDKIDLSSNNSQ